MARLLSRRPFASLAALLLGAAGLGGLSVATAAPASAATGCSVAYAIQSDWGSGFVTGLTITNLGSPITGWTLTYSYSGNQALANGWNGNWSQSGTTVTVTNASYNGSLGTSGTANPGAQFSYSGANVNPAAFALNGVQCTGQVSGGGGSIVASASSLSVAQGTTGTVGISLSAPPTSNVTVTTTRAAGNTGLSVTGGGSLTFTPANFSAPQNIAITADSTSSGAATFTASGSGFTSVSVTVTEVATGGGGGSGPAQSWGSNVVRMPLNEACWNGESYVNSAYSGANYQNAIKSEVSLMNASGLVVILDLHWTDGAYTGPSAGCSSAQAVCQKPMPDAAQAIPFWSSVASAFKGNDAVIFDLFNEPYASRADNNNSAEGWQCWETGSPCTGISYQVASAARNTPTI